MLIASTLSRAAWLEEVGHRAASWAGLRHIFSTYTEIVDPGKAKTWQLNPKLAGGGSLMDIGIYCVNTMRWVAGSTPIDATAHRWTDDPQTLQ